MRGKGPDTRTKERDAWGEMRWRSRSITIRALENTTNERGARKKRRSVEIERELTFAVADGCPLAWPCLYSPDARCRLRQHVNIYMHYSQPLRYRHTQGKSVSCLFPSISLMEAVVFYLHTGRAHFEVNDSKVMIHHGDHVVTLQPLDALVLKTRKHRLVISQLFGKW